MPFPSSDPLKVKDFLFAVEGNAEQTLFLTGQEFRGKAAIRRTDGTWTAERAHVSRSFSGRVEVECSAGTDSITSNAIAYPVDPRTADEDINGATILKPNADDTGWLFYHAEPADHHHREVLLEGAITGLFQPAIDELEIELFKYIHLDNGQGQQTTRLHHLNLIAFRNAVSAKALANARKHTIGHYARNPADEHIHPAILEAIRQTTADYLADTEKAVTWSQIGGFVAPITKRLFSELHSYEAPWDRRERLKREAAEAAAKEAAATQND